MDKLNNNSFQGQSSNKQIHQIKKPEKDISLFFDENEYNKNHSLEEGDNQYISALLERQINIMKKLNRNCG